MPTFTAVANPSGQPSAPAFTNIINVTFGAAGAELYAATGYLMGLQARIGAGRTIRRVTARGFVTATGAWDGVRWEYNVTSDRLMGFKAVGNAIADQAAPIGVVADIGDELSTAPAVSNITTITVQVVVESD